MPFVLLVSFLTVAKLSYNMQSDGLIVDMHASLHDCLIIMFLFIFSIKFQIKKYGEKTKPLAEI